MTEKNLIIVASGNSELGQSVVQNLLTEDNFEIAATYRSEATDLNKTYLDVNKDPNKYCFKADLRDVEQVQQMISKVAKLGRIWGIINFSGEASSKRLFRTSQPEIENVIMNNLMPAVNLTTEFLKYVSVGGFTGGRLIQISSITVRRPLPGTVPYVIAKSGIEGLVRSSAEELGRFQITTNALRLGYFDRGMAKRDVPSEILETISKSTASRSLGMPHNLSTALNYLLDKNSDFQTGSIIDLDGGLF